MHEHRLDPRRAAQRRRDARVVHSPRLAVREDHDDAVAGRWSEEVARLNGTECGERRPERLEVRGGRRLLGGDRLLERPAKDVLVRARK